MGEVYLAKDTTLERKVAIKVLPADVASSPERLQRFEREAKTVATLNHPNIVTIHGIHNEGNHRFIALELVEGETLDRMIPPGGIPLSKIFDIAIPLADALAAAHDKGIVHRDLKPANVMITNEGRVKVLDFGLAKLTAGGRGGSSADDVTMSVPLTGRGMVIGTVPYMSPEQLQSKPVDHRSDIFSLGIMLYEMASGMRPFKGDSSAAVMSAILRDPPRPLHELNGLLPRHLGRIIEHCLEKDQEKRFQSAKDIRNELWALRKEVESGSDFSESVSTPATSAVLPTSTPSTTSSGSTMSAPTRRGEFWIGIGVIGILLIAGFWYVRSGSESGTTPPTQPLIQIRTLAVLPLNNLSGDPAQDYFVDAMAVAITDELAKIGALTVISARTMMRYKGSDRTLPQIAQEIDVAAFITGSAVQVGDRVRISVQLIEAATQRQMWSAHYDRDKRDILAVHSEVARAVADGIKIVLTPSEKESLASAPQVNWQAYDAYIRGLELLRRSTRSSCTRAIGLFDQALAIDPKFARALAAKATAYGALASTHLPPKDTLPEMKRAALAALELDNTLAEAHIALGNYKMEFEWDWDGARESFQEALASGEKRGSAHLAYASWLCAMNRLDEAMAQLDLAQELDHSTRYNDRDFGFVSFMARRYERTIRDGQAALDFDPEFWHAHEWLGLAKSQRGRSIEAISHLRQALALGNSPQTAAMLGGVLAVAGKSVEARDIRKRLKERKDIEYVCPYEVATISIGLNEFDQAFEEISEACDDRAACIPWLRVDPRLDPIRDDARFDLVLERVGFEPTHRSLTVVNPPSGKIMLAILPFENVSNDPDTDYLSNEIPASIIDKLSGLSDLRVISRSGAFRFDRTKEDASSFGRNLGASVVLTGQLNAHGINLTIRAELVDVVTNEQIWSKRYARELADIMAVETDITQSISDALRIQLTAQERTQLGKANAVNPDAYRSFLQGRFWTSKFTADSYRKAVFYFEQAIQDDPKYASAYAALAITYTLLGGWSGDMPPREAFPKAKKAVSKALEMDPTLADAHGSLAFIRLLYDWDFQGAEKEFKHAIRINPDSSAVHGQYALLLHAMGRFDQAQEERKRALELDPLSSMTQTALAWGYAQNGEYEQAIKICKEVLRLDSSFAPAYQALGFVFFEQGMYEDAITAFQQKAQVNHNAHTLGWLGVSYARAGNRTGALATLDGIEQASTTGPRRVPAAMVHAALGNIERVFELLEVAYDERESNLVWLNTLLPFEALRGDPRFNDLLQRIGLEPESKSQSETSR